MFDPNEMEQALIGRAHRKAIVSGTVTVPAVPGMVDKYVTMCTAMFARVGSVFNAEQTAHLRLVLEGQATKGYEESEHSDIVITFDKPFGVVLSYNVNVQVPVMADAFVRDDARTEPDARIWTLATAAPDPKNHRILDVGAGTGRNALALARRGHPVHAVANSSSVAARLNAVVETESLDMRVIEGDLFAVATELGQDYQLIVVSEVVPDFRTADQLRTLFELAANTLEPGGQIVFNTFMYRGDLELGDETRQVSRQMRSNVFSWDEMRCAATGFGLELVSDDCVYEYEAANLPTGVWPPAPWYPEWVAGQDVFDLPREKCPNGMRWLVYRKPQAAPVEVQREQAPTEIVKPAPSDARVADQTAASDKPRKFKFLRFRK